MQRMVFRKSWPNYVRPLMGLIIAIALIYLIASRYLFILNALSDFFSAFLGDAEFDVHAISETIGSYIIWAGLAILGIWVIRTLLRLVWLWTFRIEIGKSGLSARYGVLPWNKWSRTWEPDQIFGCLYRQSGFLNWLARHGDLVLTGREGTTNEFVFTRIGRVKRACEMVNAIRHRPYQSS